MIRRRFLQLLAAFPFFRRHVDQPVVVPDTPLESYLHKVESGYDVNTKGKTNKEVAIEYLIKALHENWDDATERFEFLTFHDDIVTIKVDMWGRNGRCNTWIEFCENPESEWFDSRRPRWNHSIRNGNYNRDMKQWLSKHKNPYYEAERKMRLWQIKKGYAEPFHCDK